MRASCTRNWFPHVRRWSTWPVRTLLVTDSLQCGQMYSHNFLFCAAFLSFAGTVALLVGLAPSLPVACKSVCCSRASSVQSLGCFAFGSACCVAALSTSRFRFFLRSHARCPRWAFVFRRFVCVVLPSARLPSFACPGVPRNSLLRCSVAFDGWSAAVHWLDSCGINGRGNWLFQLYSGVGGRGALALK